MFLLLTLAISLSSCASLREYYPGTKVIVQHPDSCNSVGVVLAQFDYKIYLIEVECEGKKYQFWLSVDNIKGPVK